MSKNAIQIIVNHVLLIMSIRTIPTATQNMVYPINFLMKITSYAFLILLYAAWCGYLPYDSLFSSGKAVAIASSSVGISSLFAVKRSMMSGTMSRILVTLS